MFGFIFSLVCLGGLMVFGGFTAAMANHPFEGWILVALSVVPFGTAGFVLAINKLYIRTSANKAFYRTGMGTPCVFIDGGGYVVPVIHEVTEVLLETMKFEVNRSGPEALICKDFLRVDVAAEFYIRVNKTAEGVKAAATTLGKDAMHPEQIKLRLFEKLVSALRTVSATMELNELHQNREDFASRVMEAVTKDIEPNGFILETVTISQLDQSDIKNLNKENVFDAQGLRKAAEITEAQLVIKNKIEKQAELDKTRENVATRKQVLEQEQERAFAEADQKAKVANREAERRREIEEFQISQEEEIAKRQVLKEQAVQATEIQRQAALVTEDQKRETAEVSKQQAVEVALREKLIAVAEAEGRKAQAEAQKNLAQAKEREAHEKVTTAAEVEVARREKEKAVIKAEQVGEQQLIELQKAADAEAYTKTRKAEAEREAAENEAQARIRLAEANLEAKRREAEGEKALGIVPVEVDAERIKVRRTEAFIPIEVDKQRVEVEQKRVEVLRQELEAKDEHQQAAIHLELSRARITASQEVGVKMAEAIGKFMSQGSFQVFGDPTTLSDMTRRFSEGLGLSQVVLGLKEGNPLIGEVVESGLEAASAGLEAARAKAQEVKEKSTGKTRS